MLRKIIVLVVVILGVLVFFALQPQPPAKPLSQEDAQKFVLDDLNGFSSRGADLQITGARQTDDGVWQIDVLIAENPHSNCPVLSKRFYTLVPFSFRPEPVISNCNYRKMIVYREEALIDSAQSAVVNSFISGDPFPYGCAFKISDFEEQSALAYCPKLDVSAFNAFASGLSPDDWVVLWATARESKLFAFNNAGGLEKS